MSELPGRWGELLGPKGIHSYADLANAVGQGVGKATVHRLVSGGATSVETVNKVAAALFDGDRDLVWSLRGSSRRDYGDWDLPAEASLLTAEQRDAVIKVIQVMVPDEQEGGGAHERGAAPTSPKVPSIREARKLKRDRMVEEAQEVGEAAYDGDKK